ncbi:GNAT family N-acetyltransferase [Arthrobacter gengyunqii]|uniref:GNAT family N-acetyltransferase n=1 Tax=Arthrobacter gengyunqii TaxID=2886940 RepID=A0ABS8GFQ8_9MICC|nr:GNAT family N-acetyltransferase [Arthrobacter gengyunqii]MCC3264827.1 GNAT family N-acetyltransferase [Arthrobacter gengyunqii]
MRRIVPADHDAAIRIHTDPRTTRYNQAPPTIEKSERLLEFFLEHWNREGFGYWAVAERSCPETVIGFTGLHRAQVAGHPVLNLYYRYDPPVWRRGYAVEGAREAVRRGRELLPELPVLASTSDRNLASQRTALAAGLQRHAALDRQVGHAVDVYFTLGWPATAG